jgi:hypothetical protein
MTTYNIKKRSFFSIGPHLLGLLFVAIGAFTIASPLFMPGNNSVLKAIGVGSAAVIFGSMVIASYSGILFDFTNQRYQSYYALCGFRMGQWQALSSIKLIKLFPHTYKGATTTNGVNPSSITQVTHYIIALYSDKFKPVLVIENDYLDKALIDAKILSDKLSAPLELNLPSN